MGKSLVAYHEVGHAICGTLTPGDDPALISKSQLQARIVGALGGRAAEEVVFGKAEVTTGASGDLQQIAGMAKQMVTVFGMSDCGPWALQDPSASQGDMIMRMMARNSMSEKLANDIDKAVQKIADEGYAIALKQLQDNKEAMDVIVEELMIVETMSGDRMREILSQYTTIPEENLIAAQPKEYVA